jgi:serine protease Do
VLQIKLTAGRILTAACAGILLVTALGMSDPAAAQRRNAPDTFADLADRLSPAVVNISTSQYVRREGDEDIPFEQFPPGHPFGDLFRDWLERNPDAAPVPQQTTSLGSGFVIDEDGVIVTNYHVVTGADTVTVTFTDGTTLDATLVGADEPTDIAVLRVQPLHPLDAVSFGDSDGARVGDWVMAIGNPFGLGGTVTAGIISARNRDIYSGLYDDFIQTDAAINRGNSGGPLFNMDGEVVGVNSAIISPSGGSIGIGFAIPSSTAELIVRQILEFGEVRRGWLGVRVQTVTDQIAESLDMERAEGALISGVTAGGPADEAGIERGDVVVEFDGHEIGTMRSLPRVVSQTEVGRRVEVRVWREGRYRTLRVTVGELEDDQAAAAADLPQFEGESGRISSLGFTVAEITAALREEYDLRANAEGVVVTNVEEGSPAAESLAPGDVILEVEREYVRNVGDVARVVGRAEASGHDVVLFLIERDGQASYEPVRFAN